MLFFNILLFKSSSFNEAYFENQENQCICAIKTHECNTYCDCDPFCTIEQKDEFNKYFQLPESFVSYKIACDPHNRIDKTNINSISKEIIDGVACYSIKEKEYGKKIINFSPKDFGLDIFDHSVDNPLIHNKFVDNNTTPYQIGDKLIGYHFLDDDKYYQYFYLPVAIGSIIANAFLPIRFGISYPNYTCRLFFNQSIYPRAYVIENLTIQNIISRNLSHSTLVANLGFFPLLFNLNELIYSFFDFQYIFKVNFTTNTVDNVSIKFISQRGTFQEGIDDQDLPSSIDFSSKVFFRENANEFDNIYQALPMGYYYGVPLIADIRNDDDVKPYFFNIEKRTPIKENSEDILFGVNATIIKFYDEDNYSSIDKVYNYSYLLDEGFDEKVIKQILFGLFPPYKYIHKSYGSIVASPDTCFYIDRISTFNSLNTDLSYDLQFPIAYWTFFYKVFNNESAPVYLLQKFVPSLALPRKLDENKKQGMIKVIFIELDSKGNIYSKEEERFHSGKFSILFDFLFVESDSLKTISVFFCFAILGTIWSWYTCFFYIED